MNIKLPVLTAHTWLFKVINVAKCLCDIFQTTFLSTYFKSTVHSSTYHDPVMLSYLIVNSMLDN